MSLAGRYDPRGKHSVLVVTRWKKGSRENRAETEARYTQRCTHTQGRTPRTQASGSFGRHTGLRWATHTRDIVAFGEATGIRERKKKLSRHSATWFPPFYSPIFPGSARATDGSRSRLVDVERLHEHIIALTASLNCTRTGFHLGNHENARDGLTTERSTSDIVVASEGHCAHARPGLTAVFRIPGRLGFTSEQNFEKDSEFVGA